MALIWGGCLGGARAEKPIGSFEDAAIVRRSWSAVRRGHPAPVEALILLVEPGAHGAAEASSKASAMANEALANRRDIPLRPLEEH
jgi:hypothetical protein